MIIVNLNDFYIVLNLHEWKPVSTTEKKGYYNFLTILMKLIFSQNCYI